MKFVFLAVVIGMIAYDLSIHIIYLFKKEEYFLVRNINYWPNWTGFRYQIFWSSFWAIALALLVSFALAV